MLRSPLLFMLLAMGCSAGVSVPQNAPPVDVSGTATAGGKPLSEISIALQPTGQGMPSGFKVVNGAFQGKVIPGKYAWFVAPLSSSKGNDVYKTIPAVFRESSLDRQIEITGPTTSLVFQLD
ncbi:hypothetical protein [Planctomicrobium sp. SH664]|uniref:hypothetical protein n=1 Tax=Planctomicrobium sp. SH664 TaxID=3448125 RepID=UPI003F5B4D59